MLLAAASVHARVLKQVVGCQRLVLVADEEGLQEGNVGRRQDRKFRAAGKGGKRGAGQGGWACSLSGRGVPGMTTGACRLYRRTASTAMQGSCPGWEKQQPRTSMQASRGKPSCSSLR